MQLGEAIIFLEANETNLMDLVKKLKVQKKFLIAAFSNCNVYFNNSTFNYNEHSINLNENILVESWKIKKIPKPQDNIKWILHNECITYSEIIELLDQIESENERQYVNFTRDSKHIIAVYITEYLEHPLDSILVTKECTKPLLTDINLDAHIIACVNIIGIYIALKNRIKIPIEISATCFNRIYLKSTQNNDNQPQKVVINCYLKVIIPLIANIDRLNNELEKICYIEGRYSSINRGANLYYFIIIFLLNAQEENNKCKIDWIKLNAFDMEISNVYKINNYLPIKRNDRIAMNFIYYIKFGLHRTLLENFNETLSIIQEDEIRRCFNLYRNYLINNSRSTEVMNKALQLLSHRPTELLKTSQLTIDNIKIIIDNYIKYGIENNIKHSTIRRRFKSFCQVLFELKDLIDENGYNSEFKIPYEKYDIGNGTIYRWKMQNSNQENLLELKNQKLRQTLMEYGVEKLKSKNIPIREGTFKDDIDQADMIVRAIYNYKIPYDQESVEYFNELQLKTMLMIIADSGARFSEILSMMYGTLSYLKEEDCYICILGWSKLFERFGVVPISNQTANMIKLCSEIRQKNYPESIYIEHQVYRSKSKLKSETKYVLQFIYILQKEDGQKKYRGISEYRIREFLKKVCKEVGVNLTPGKSFHSLRHRAAEYFFFCLSYYDYEYKNDYDYKEQVVKRLLRHRSIGMTKKYNWSRLLDILAEGKLVFMKSLPDLSNYTNNDAKFHEETIKKRMQKELKDIVTDVGINKIIKLLTVPFGLIDQDLLERVSKEKSFKLIINNLAKVDGNKGFVPEGAAYFGLCTNFSCPKLFNNITCISCNDHILQERDIPRAIDEVIRCYQTINEIYLHRYDEVSSIDHIKSLRGRVTSLLERLNQELNCESMDILHLISNRLEFHKSNV